MMRLKQWRNVWLGAAAMFAAPLSHAQDAAREMSPPADDVVMLPCDGQCVTTTPPKKISGIVIRPPHWGPSSLQGASGTRITLDIPPEGVVELQFTIKADGSVSDVDVLCLFGPQSFADGARRAVRDWRFEPAMASGKPIAVTQRLRVYYGSGETQSARTAIVTGYNDAVEMIKAGKADEADDKLVAMSRLPNLNFYEAGMLTYARATLAMQRRDCVEAQQLSRRAFMFADSLLRPRQESLYRVNIAASLCFGDVVGAAKTLGYLKKEIGISETDPLAAQVESLKEKIDQLPSYAMELKIPAEGSVGVDIPLYRRDFTFTKVAGALSSFTARCRERQFDSPITDKAEWHLPKGWSDCSLWVRGKPGTTFQIVQFAGAVPTKMTE
jgi:TonB family protein